MAKAVPVKDFKIGETGTILDAELDQPGLKKELRRCREVRVAGSGALDSDCLRIRCVHDARDLREPERRVSTPRRCDAGFSGGNTRTRRPLSRPARETV